VRAFVERLPKAVDRRIRLFGVASLVAQILVVGTGGAVRLTGSGLGCPTWPTCTADSFITTPEMGAHGAIEFGNRVLGVLLVVIGLIMFVLVVRIRKQRRDLFALSLVLGLGIPAQAVIGGISVLTSLNPYVVGLHFVVSIGLVVLATVLVFRAYTGPRGPWAALPRWYTVVTIAAAVLGGLTIVMGILTTGSGPHAGDSGASRNGLNSEVLQHVHSWPAYATFAATILLLLGALRLRNRRLVRFTAVLLGVEVLQIAVGLTQARLGLPEILVGAHMVLACCFAAAMTAVVLGLRSAQAPEPLTSAGTPDR
jgi:cytochrome c oxidase assembly protein subunit 15